jgi:hypothetical protein
MSQEQKSSEQKSPGPKDEDKQQSSSSGSSGSKPAPGRSLSLTNAPTKVSSYRLPNFEAPESEKKPPAKQVDKVDTDVTSFVSWKSGKPVLHITVEPAAEKDHACAVKPKHKDVDPACLTVPVPTGPTITTHVQCDVDRDELQRLQKEAATSPGPKKMDGAEFWSRMSHFMHAVRRIACWCRPHMSDPKSAESAAGAGADGQKSVSTSK